MGTLEFPNLGKHCSVDDCKLIDFLPFTCDRCKQVFCLQHRTYTKHLCPNADQKDVTVVVCPLCAKGVRLVPNEDPNITWEAHVNGDCDPSNYHKATNKKRCPVPGCRELLTFSNTIRCRDCTREHCLNHRFGPDHRCPGGKKKKPDSAGFPFAGMLKRNPNGWGSSILNAASTVRASAEASVQRLSNATNQALQKAKDGMGQNSGEQCVQCEARFSSVSDLIDHVERVHRVTIDACPKCSKGFRDPVLLVEHVERDHGGTSIA